MGQDYKNADFIFVNNISEVNKNYDDKYKLMSATNSVTIDGRNIVIVVDAGSPFNIIEIDINNVILVKHFENYCTGAARNTGIEMALEYFNPDLISFINNACKVDIA